MTGIVEKICEDFGVRWPFGKEEKVVEEKIAPEIKISYESSTHNQRNDCEPAGPAPIPSVAATSTQQALDQSLENLLRVLEKPFGADISYIPEKAIELAEMGASPAVVNKIVTFYLRKADWKTALSIAEASGRTLTKDESDSVFHRFVAGGRLDKFAEMAESFGYPDEQIIVDAVGQTQFHDDQWESFRKIAGAFPTPGIVHAAMNTCCLRKGSEAALAIAELSQCSEPDKQTAAEIVFAEGSFEAAKAAVKKLFDRDELLSAEIMAVSRAAERIAEAKRKWHEQDANCDDE